MSKADRKGSGNRQNVIIKKEEVVEGEGHGGAWKVAYADFVTAMMAFFLLMWLLNATTEDQRKGLADYFSPNNLLSHASSGTGDPFGGHTAFDQGALVSDRGAVQVITGTRPTHGRPLGCRRPARLTGAREGGRRPGSRSGPADGAAHTAIGAAGHLRPTPPRRRHRPLPRQLRPAAGPAVGAATAVNPSPPAPVAAIAVPRAPTEAELRAAQEREEKAAFNEAAQQIRDAVRGDPALADLARQLAIDITPQGLRIQILDEDHRSMFPLGSDLPNDRAKLLLQKVTPVLARLSQDISIAGYTDSAPFPGPDRTNWELSTERANATRRLLVEGGLPDSRIRSVTGNADRDPLVPDNPLAAANRRIAIVVLRAARPAEAAPEGLNAGAKVGAGVGTAWQTPGDAATGNATGGPAAARATAAHTGHRRRAPAR